MSKFKLRTLVLLLVVAILMIAQHQSKLKLQAEILALRALLDQLSMMATENNALSNQATQILPLQASPNEPDRELLRLRGEVAALRRDRDELENLRQRDAEDLAKLRQENRALRGPTINETYGLWGIDTNGLPAERGATRDEVLTQLQQLGAKFLKERDDFIWAEFPVGATRNGDSNPFTSMRMEFFFEDGKLASRNDHPIP